jgi:glycerol kinase
MQFQADVLGCRVDVAAERETTALGAAALAGLATGLWPDREAVRERLRPGAVYEPAPDAEVERLRDDWQLALRRTLLT